MKIRIIIINICCLLFLYLPIHSVYAQTEPELPVYVVQTGDSLSVIAVRFGTTVEELIEVNEIEDPNAISAGTTLKIPGFEGLGGELILQTVNLGETYANISAINNFPDGLLIQLNRLTGPNELFVGSRIVMPKVSSEQQLMPLTQMMDGMTLTEISIEHGLNPWRIRLQNHNDGYHPFVPGAVVYSTLTDTEQRQVYPGLTSLSIEPLPLSQGKTIVIRVKSLKPLDFHGTLAGYALQFSTIAENEYIALQGIDARHPIGVTDINLQGDNAGNQEVAIEQKLLIEPGYYGQDPPITVDPITIQADVIEPEQVLIEEITGAFSPERHWDDTFQYPVDEPCIAGYFGGSRIYNGSYHYYHTGIDFSVCSANNLNIYAVAPGVVVYTGSLIVRGNAVVIDHGWGVYSGYWHQSEIAVNTGDFVETGQLLGQIGNTGRSTGPHLHLEIWVNGVQVDPLDWLLQKYP